MLHFMISIPEVLHDSQRLMPRHALSRPRRASCYCVQTLRRKIPSSGKRGQNSLPRPPRSGWQRACLKSQGKRNSCNVVQNQSRSLPDRCSYIKNLFTSSQSPNFENFTTQNLVSNFQDPVSKLAKRRLLMFQTFNSVPSKLKL